MIKVRTPSFIPRVADSSSKISDNSITSSEVILRSATFPNRIFFSLLTLDLIPFFYLSLLVYYRIDLSAEAVLRICQGQKNR